ncbi:ATP-binding SpoIIE family protein phosphatase [Kineococcus rhizosphaerae]|uniref:Serine phosphatase RsbU (Regulator of sigma subunit) n=1 Tax=Kineococcus rhizosphaerae TaxID=559628 RepID=A0A2T0QXS6_9ACTN|nr:SpoIIE family protein phosphatase [Kineococcus rhizosphaerae]PRY10842.1 serine phosphatase RsbU (regulator of sigma subunit) [Kineococcus rhizosphaerae]
MLEGLHRHLQAITRPEVSGDLPALLRAASRAAREVGAADHCVAWFAGADGHGPAYLVDGEGFLDVAVAPFGTRAAALRDVPLPGLAEVAAHVLVCPLDADGSRGALVLTRGSEFTGDQAQAAGVLALALGMAVETTLRSEAERSAARAASRSALLERISSLLQKSATTAEITARIPQAVVEVLDCLSSSLYVLDGDDFAGRSHPPLPAAWQDRFDRFDRRADTPVAEAVRTGRPLVVTRAEIGRYRELDGVDPDRIGVTLVVPLAGRDDHVLGALNVNWGDRSPLEHGDLDLFAGVALQVAVALERAQLLDAERSSREALSRSHEALDLLARDLQRGLLPSRMPQREGLQIATRYAPALAGAEIGGDWFDAVQTGDDIALIIGDVQGHSTRAAGLMGQVRTAVRAYVSEGHDPSAALERTNRLLVDLDAGRFATCCLVRLDAATGMLSVASAGHQPPLVVDDSGLHEVAVDPGPPLGVLHEAVYPTTRYRLLGRSAVLLYTDGVVEVSGQGSDHGERVLRDTLLRAAREDPPRPAELLASAVVEAIPHALTDDAALLVATFTGADAGRLEASLWLPPDIRAVAAAREFLRDRLTAWSTDELLDEAELVLSELVTNALVHTGGGAGLALRFDGAHRRLTISVEDSSTRSPHERAMSPDALGGRGLGIVEAVADAWGVRVGEQGKTVWADLAVEAD